MAVKSIQLGQVWRNDADGQDYLVTKLYSEVFTQYALLRPAGLSAPDVATVRVKVSALYPQTSCNIWLRESVVPRCSIR